MTITTEAKPKKQNIFVASNILALIGWISVNIYLPTIPHLEIYFHTSAKTLSWSISLFLLGFSISQFFWGSLSEHLGRKKPVIYALSICIPFTLLAVFAPNIYIFNLARFFEGLMIGASPVLTRAILADSFTRIELSRAVGSISSIANIMPALAPIIGGYLLILFNWQAVFIFLVIYTLAVIIIFYYFVDETNVHLKSAFSFKSALYGYWTIINNIKFWNYSLPYLLLSGGMIGFYSATPYIFIKELHIKASHYSFISILTVISYIVGAYFSSRVANKLGFKRGILLGIIVSLISGCIMLLLCKISTLSVSTVIFPMMIYTFAAGLVGPNSNSCAMGLTTHIAGAAGAMLGALLYACATIFTIIITSMNLAHLLSLTSYILSIGILSFLGFYNIIKNSDN